MGISSVCWDEKGRCLTNFRGGDLELMDFGGSMDDSVPTLELEVRAGIQTGWVGWGAQPAGALALFSWSLLGDRIFGLPFRLQLAWGWSLRHFSGLDMPAYIKKLVRRVTPSSSIFRFCGETRGYGRAIFRVYPKRQTKRDNLQFLVSKFLC